MPLFSDTKVVDSALLVPKVYKDAADMTHSENPAPRARIGRVCCWYPVLGWFKGLKAHQIKGSHFGLLSPCFDTGANVVVLYLPLTYLT